MIHITAVRCLLKAKARTTCKHNDRNYPGSQKKQMLATRRQQAAQAVGTHRPRVAETTAVCGHTGHEHSLAWGRRGHGHTFHTFRLSLLEVTPHHTRNTIQGCGGGVIGWTGCTNAPGHNSKVTEGRAPHGNTRPRCCQAHGEAPIGGERSPVAIGRWHPLRSSSAGGHYSCHDT